MTKVFYDVSLTPASDPSFRPDMRAEETARWAQVDSPTSAVAICRPGAAVTDGDGDLRDCTIHYVDAQGREVNTANYAGSGAAGWHIATSEYDEAGNEIRSLSAGAREEALNADVGAGAALGLSSNTAAAALELSSVSQYAPNSYDGRLDLVATFGPYHSVKLGDGSIQGARAYTSLTYDNSTGDTDPETGHPVDALGHPTSLHLVVSTTSAASLSRDAVPTSLTDVVRTDRRYYTASDTTTGWKFQKPLKVIADVGGLNLTQMAKYDSDSGNLVQRQSPMDTAGVAPGTTAGTTKILYYVAGTGSGDSLCDNKPQWAGYICKMLPATTGATTTLPGLVSTWYKSYDHAGRQLEIQETATPANGGTPVTRTYTTVYGFNSTVTNGISANPYATTEVLEQVTGGLGTSMSAQSYTYSATTGFQTSMTSGSLTESTTYDDFGRRKTYSENTGATGAASNPVSLNYDPNAGWLTSASDAHSSSAYSHSSASGEHRGMPTAVTLTVGSSPTYTGTFTATYDADGSLASESDPSGVVSTVTRNEVGEVIELRREKGGVVWLDDTALFNAASQRMQQAAASGSQDFAYDGVGRLTRVADRAAIGDCITRTYTYDADSNRLTSTSFPGNIDGSCQETTGGTTQQHSYDDGDRLKPAGTDAGVQYDAFNRIINLPASDTNSGESVQAAYFANDTVRSQTVGSGTTAKVQTWGLDAAQRLANWTVTTGGTTTASKTNHFDDGSDSPAWVAENAAGTAWTAYLHGLGGFTSIAVTQSGVPTYAFGDTHGTISATSAAGDTTPTAGVDYTEFGENPGLAGSTTANPRYGWMGAAMRSSEDQAGLVLMGARLYSPTLGRFLQVDPVTGGSANAFDYANQDPVNSADPSGALPSDCQTDGGCATLPNKATAYYFFKFKKRPKARHAAGIVGNFMYESGVDPTQKELGPPYLGRGIAQWNKGQRWDSLVTWAKRRHLDRWNLQTQLRFAWHEMTDHFVGNIYTTAFDHIVATDNYKAATSVACEEYEQPGSCDASISDRRGYAHSLLLEYG